MIFARDYSFCFSGIIKSEKDFLMKQPENTIQSASQPAKNQKYVTTAISYVNGKPHIGNAMDYLLADIWARYQMQNGYPVRFQIGVDEHGTKIAVSASQNEQTPQEFADTTHVYFKDLADKINIDFTDFIRTSDTRHKQTVQYIWQQLKPYIYKGTYEGWYSVGEEAFVSDKVAAANDGVSPDHGVPYERLSEENYYFKLSAFSEKIRESIESDRIKIVPRHRKQEILNLLDEGVEDVSISRPRKSLSWGIPVPDDPGHVMYVWFDALSNYLSVLDFPQDDGWRSFWPADLQVVGKDILRFHAIIWPAMLMGLGLPLPKVILAHGHISSGGRKMSKTRGNVVDPSEIIDNYGVDAFRYYFSRYVPTLDDGDFTWERFETVYNSELSNDLGNLIQRVTGMINRYQAGVVGDLTQNEHDMKEYHEAFKNYHFDEALTSVWSKVRALNQYIDNVKPWEIAKRVETDSEAKEHLAEVMSYLSGALVQISDLLLPFMPTTARMISSIFETGVVQFDGQPIFPKIYLHTKDPRGAKQVEK